METPVISFVGWSNSGKTTLIEKLIPVLRGKGLRIGVLKRNVEDTKNLMASAGSTYLEVITAESNLLNSQLNKVQDDFSKMQAVVNLYYALGGGAK